MLQCDWMGAKTIPKKSDDTVVIPSNRSQAHVLYSMYYCYGRIHYGGCRNGKSKVFSNGCEVSLANPEASIVTIGCLHRNGARELGYKLQQTRGGLLNKAPYLLNLCRVSCHVEHPWV